MSHTFNSICMALVLPGLLYGQNPPPPIPGLPGVQGGTPENENPGPANLTQAISAPDPDAQVEMELNFLNMDGFSAASIYQALTGKRVLLSSAAAQAQFAFVQAPGLTNAEAARLLEETFLMEGYEITPSTRDGDIVKLVAATQPGGAASVVAPTPVVDNPASLSLHDGVVSYVMTFQYLKPEEAQRAFTQIFSQLRPGGTIAEVRNASSLIITEKAELIEKMVELKEKIDVPSAQVAHDFVEVQYADVVELAEILNEMFNTQSSSNQSARVQRAQQTTPAGNTPPIPGLTNAAGQQAGSVGEETPPTITPDSRTNRIFMMGRPQDIVFIKQLVSKWDVPSDQRNFLRVKLRYLPVYEFVPVAEAAIARTLGDAASASGGTGSTARSTTNTTGSSSRFGNAGGTTSSQSSNSFGNTGSTTSGSSSGTASLAGSDRPTEPQAFQVGNTLLVSDNVSNSIIVQGPPHHIELVENLIGELDVKNDQVAITAVFGRYQVSEGLTFGVDLARIMSSNGVAFQSFNGNGIIEPETISSFANLAAPAGLSIQGYAGDFGVFINALESVSSLRTFARPTIFTTNNKEARISSGRQIAIPTNTYQSSLSDSLSTNIEYRDVALELLVRPLVNDGNEITLEISLVRDAVGNESSVQQTDISIPDLFSDQLDTIVTIPNGSAVLLGGLIEDSENLDDSGVPVLRSIPLLGNLFKNTGDSAGRSELVIMIRPTLVSGQDAVNQYQRYYDYGSNFSPEVRAQFSAGPYESRNFPLEKRAVVPAPSAKSGVNQHPHFNALTPSSRAIQQSVENEKLAIEKQEKKRTSFARKHKR
ncbi:MAG: secretin N-terminal domain-containing protein [Verrucomicrobiota bacterium JB023]|nr:secretin N-terminal domain-containing protein [Verrucomicrobiota bacterium JB023]